MKERERKREKKKERRIDRKRKRVMKGAEGGGRPLESMPGLAGMVHRPPPDRQAIRVQGLRNVNDRFVFRTSSVSR
jgi:hypothetical protein